MGRGDVGGEAAKGVCELCGAQRAAGARPPAISAKACEGGRKRQSANRCGARVFKASAPAGPKLSHNDVVFILLWWQGRRLDSDGCSGNRARHLDRGQDVQPAGACWASRPGVQSAPQPNDGGRAARRVCGSHWVGWGGGAFDLHRRLGRGRGVRHHEPAQRRGVGRGHHQQPRPLRHCRHRRAGGLLGIHGRLCGQHCH